MADKKITALTSLGTATARADLLHLIDNVAGTPTNVKVTIGEFANALSTPIALADSSISLTEAVHAHRTLIVPTIASTDKTWTLPTPIAGMTFKFIYGAPAVGTLDALIACGTGNTVYFEGGIAHHDTNETGQTTAMVLSNGSSNELLQMNLPLGFEINLVALTTTQWYISGWVASATAPTFAD